MNFAYLTSNFPNSCKCWKPPRLFSGNLFFRQTLSNCARTLDDFYDAGGSTLVTNTYTNPGACTMTAPKNGYYNICAHAR